jgi:DNA repair exonuclease SbcCD ATPase subunit
MSQPAPDASDIAIIRFRLEIVEQQLSLNAKLAAELRDEIRDMMVEIRTSAERTCPAPGKCIDLSSRFDEHEESIKELRENLQQAKGAARAAIMIAAAISGIVGFISGILDLWKK